MTPDPTDREVFRAVDPDPDAVLAEFGIESPDEPDDLLAAGGAHDPDSADELEVDELTAALFDDADRSDDAPGTLTLRDHAADELELVGAGPTTTRIDTETFGTGTFD